MSRIGKLPVVLSDGVKAKIEDNYIVITGPKGELRQQLHKLAQVEVSETEVLVSVKNPDDGEQRSFWGLYRSLINNMVIGVTEGFSKTLEINGVGYRAALQGNSLNLSLGFSHPVNFELPQGISAEVKGNVVTISGIDKQLVGEVAAKIRKIRKPEPYKGKGIKYSDEIIRRKAGKAASKGA